MTAHYCNTWPCPICIPTVLYRPVRTLIEYQDKPLWQVPDLRPKILPGDSFL